MITYIELITSMDKPLVIVGYGERSRSVRIDVTHARKVARNLNRRLRRGEGQAHFLATGWMYIPRTVQKKRARREVYSEREIYEGGER